MKTEIQFKGRTPGRLALAPHRFVDGILNKRSEDTVNTISHGAQTKNLERLFLRSCLEKLSFNHTTKAVPLTNRANMQLHQLKQKMVLVMLEGTANRNLHKRICGAANQAAALAWTTPYPSLVFPCLFEELADSVREAFQQQSDYAQAPRERSFYRWVPCSARQADKNDFGTATLAL